MPYITREDGERFVIPSYRDTIRANRKSLLKREVMLLATNYGDYATIQKKSSSEYEVAFSPDSGYLLGETVWAFFDKPRDLIYCEAIPNTTEAILVIVKSGSVYLDGSFPIDSIPEELIIFKTQQNAFDIYIQGDVPISQMPVEGKFSFDAASVHSFTILENPVFPTLPIIKKFQLQLIDIVLRSQGIGGFPARLVIGIVAFVILGWLIIEFIKTNKPELPATIINAVNPYQLYVTALTSPAPDAQIKTVVAQTTQLLAIPGWNLVSINYTNGALQAALLSTGARTNVLYDWAKQNNATVDILPNGIFVTLNSSYSNRLPPTTINNTTDVLASLLDRLSYVIVGNNLTINATTNKGQYKETGVTIAFQDISLATLNLLGAQLNGLPLVLSNVKVDVKEGSLSGTISLNILGT